MGLYHFLYYHSEDFEFTHSQGRLHYTETMSSANLEIPSIKYMGVLGASMQGVGSHLLKKNEHNYQRQQREHAMTFHGNLSCVSVSLQIISMHHFQQFFFLQIENVIYFQNHF